MRRLLPLGIAIALFFPTAGCSPGDATGPQAFLTVRIDGLDADHCIAPGDAIPFAASLAGTATGGAEFSWSFGDGRTSTAQDPGPVTYPEKGIFRVRVEVSKESARDVAEVRILVRDNCAPLELAIESPRDQVVLLEGETLRLAANATGGDAPYEWRWELNHPELPILQVEDPGPLAYASGEYQISVTVTDAIGDARSDARTVSVLPAPQALALGRWELPMREPRHIVSAPRGVWAGAESEHVVLISHAEGVSFFDLESRQTLVTSLTTTTPVRAQVPISAPLGSTRLEAMLLYGFEDQLAHFVAGEWRTESLANDAGPVLDAVTYSGTPQASGLLAVQRDRITFIEPSSAGDAYRVRDTWTAEPSQAFVSAATREGTTQVLAVTDGFPSTLVRIDRETDVVVPIGPVSAPGTIRCFETVCVVVGTAEVIIVEWDGSGDLKIQGAIAAEPNPVGVAMTSRRNGNISAAVSRTDGTVQVLEISPHGEVLDRIDVPVGGECLDPGAPAWLVGEVDQILLPCAGNNGLYILQEPE